MAEACIEGLLSGLRYAAAGLSGKGLRKGKTDLLYQTGAENHDDPMVSVWFAPDDWCGADKAGWLDKISSDKQERPENADAGL